MPRTLLFSSISRLLRGAGHTPRHVPEHDYCSSLTRREFVSRVVVGLSALAGSRLTAACSSAALVAPTSAASPGRSDLRVAVIGAGLAGLTCAYRLKQAGVRATVYEAATRVGGRTYTTDPGLFPGGQVAELGGEFIDTDHVTMHALAAELGVVLDDRHAALAEGVARDVWWVSGRAVPEATIRTQFMAVAGEMARLAALSEKDEAAFAKLDNTPLSAWLASNLAQQPELRSVLTSAYRGEYGLELDEQSTLNLLYLIGSDDPDPFRIFGASDERFHAQRGSQAFATELAARLAGQIELGHKLLRASGDEHRGYALGFENARGERIEARADLLVLAIPFSVLRAVDLNGLALQAHKRRVIAELGYGTNSKVMGAFAHRTWLEAHHCSGSVVSDEAYQQLWDTSIGQPGATGLLTNFLAGKQSLAASGQSAEDWFRNTVVPGAEQVFPGAALDYLAGTAVRMYWPAHPQTLGSYACYRPGQWAFSGSEGLPEALGTLHFCGEHTSVDFQGFMEGAAETGTTVAGAVLRTLGKEPSPLHAALLALKCVVPQPAYAECVLKGRWRARSTARHRAMADLAASA